MKINPQVLNYKIMGLTAEQKERVLRNISFIDQEELLDFIINKDISFEEMKKTGSLHHQKQAWLRSKVEEVGKEHEEENNFWEDCKYLDNLDKYREYISKYPEGLYIEEARNIIVRKEDDLNRERERLINDILDNSEDYSAYQIKELLDQGRILKSDLIDSGYMTRDQLQSFLNPPDFIKEELSWKDLPPLPENYTDVYLFGIPSSGKSCALAGLLNEAEDTQRLRINTKNKLGYDYSHFLIECVEVGYVPPSTPSDSVNFIECQIASNLGTHPISFIEMSGEYFVSTYKNDTLSGERTLGANGYLNNNNQKAIFFIIDYFHERRKEISYQKKLLGFALEKLKQDGIFKKTSVVKIILTKCDLMPQGENREEYAVNFLKEHYGSFIENLKEDIKKFGINKATKNSLHVHPFSLGDFKFGKVFTYDPTSSRELLEALLQSTPTIRRNGAFSRIVDEFRR